MFLIFEEGCGGFQGNVLVSPGCKFRGTFIDLHTNMEEHNGLVASWIARARYSEPLDVLASLTDNLQRGNAIHVQSHLRRTSSDRTRAEGVK